MNTSHNLKRIIARALLSGGIAVAGLGLGAGTAQADNSYGPHRWCPGQPMEWPTGPPGVAWDMSVCHTWWAVGYGQGNVASNYGPTPPGVPSIWDGDDPPPLAPRQCWSLFLPAPCPPG